MADVIQVRRGTTAQWAAATRPLADGEFGRDTTTGDLKMGNGTSLWSALSVITGGGGGAGTVKRVGDGTTYLSPDGAGDVDLSTLFIGTDAGLSADNLTSGTVALARLPAGSTITIDKAKGSFGATAGNWPTSRPTARVDVTCIWQGNTQPSTGPINGDRWAKTT